MAYRILLVEDDSSIREVIADYFSGKADGTELVTASGGAEGLRQIAQGGFDLIMLDVMLPEIDGFSLCREIRRRSDVPVLFLTARAREEDVLYGYELGCDDYMVKPFSLAALYAKTQALLKRSKGMVIQQELACGAIRLNPVTLAVYVEGRELELPPKEFAILKYLMEHKGWAVEREALLTRIWGYDYYGGDRTVDNHIKKLRKSLGTAGDQIKTVIKTGYKLTE